MDGKFLVSEDGGIDMMFIFGKYIYIFMIVIYIYKFLLEVFIR